MTKREKHLLWMILNKTIGRYILVNMPGYGSGERADLHLYISKQKILTKGNFRIFCIILSVSRKYFKLYGEIFK